jgi:GAF domain-containing protein
MGELKRALAGSPRAVLQKLAEVVLELCDAQSAGVSLLEETHGRHVFRWHAVAGRWRELLWATRVPPCVGEALLVPLVMNGATVGTVWVVAHDAERRFDGEDRRVVTELTQFAAAAYERLQSFKADDVRALSRMHLV